MAALAAPNAMAAAVAPTRWTHPLPGTCRRPYGGGQFGAPRPLGAKHPTRYHQGIDLGARTGTPIHAAAAGTVFVAGRVSANAGLGVEIRHAGSIVTKYFHASKVLVKVGQYVKAGQVIALVGATGDAVGSHLHWEVWVNGKATNPVPFMAAHGVRVGC